jgi:hypothetical protein
MKDGRLRPSFVGEARSMESQQYPTPMALVDALHRRGHGARAQLWDWLRDPFGRLMRQLAERHRFDPGHDRATEHALHLAETYLRTRPATDYQDQSWPAFRAALLLHVGKLAFLPFGGQNGPLQGPAPLPETDTYQNRTLFLPHHRIGDQAFGGDWFGGLCADDGSLWIVVADVTGHGYAAYLLASALPSVWQMCWENTDSHQPSDLLAAMHRLLEQCLPDGVFVECTLARLGLSGEVTVAPAGGTRFLLRRGGRVELVKLRGGWLGLLPPSSKDQHVFQLAAGDELLLGTDGFFDQLNEPATKDLQGASNFRPLFDHARELLRRALQTQPQLDDITLVLLRRRDKDDDRPATVPFPGPQERIGGGHVPV